MALIAMTREMGSLGKDVADELARRLSIPVVYHEVIEHLADRMRVRKSHVIRLLDGKAGILERMTADKTSMAIYTADEIFGLALKGKGAIIRGWGAPNLLSSVPHAVCVRVCAPLEVRAQRVMEIFGYGSRDQALAEIARRDAEREAAMRRRFGAGWDQGARYDLVLNTEHVGADRCIAQVKRLLSSDEFQPNLDSQHRVLALAIAARTRSEHWRQGRESRWPGFALKSHDS